MGIVGKTLVVVGDIRSTADLILDARVDGSVWCEGAVTITASASVTGDVVAHDITVHGRASGQLVATETIDVRAGAVVAGDAIASRFILHDGAVYAGHVDPARLDAALGVAKFKRKQRDAKTGT